MEQLKQNPELAAKFNQEMAQNSAVLGRVEDQQGDIAIKNDFLAQDLADVPKALDSLKAANRAMQEARTADRGGQILPQHLDGDFPVVLEVLGQIDRGHAAGAELAIDAIAPIEGGIEAFNGGHLKSKLLREARLRVAHAGQPADEPILPIIHQLPAP